MSGRRVAVTRDEGPDGRLTAALCARGHTVVHCPAVREAAGTDPERLAHAALDLERYDWLVVASPRAVEALLHARSGASLPATLRTAATGRQTAARLAEHGARDVVVAAGAGVDALLDILLAADRWPGRRVLVPRAAEGSDAIARALRDAGARVDEIVAYRTLARPPAGIAAAWRAGRPDAAVFASPSAVAATCAAIGTEALRAVECVAIGETTAAALRALGVTPVVAAEADFDSVARAVGARATAGGCEPASSPATSAALRAAAHTPPPPRETTS